MTENKVDFDEEIQTVEATPVPFTKQNLHNDQPQVSPVNKNKSQSKLLLLFVSIACLCICGILATAAVGVVIAVSNNAGFCGSKREDERIRLVLANNFKKVTLSREPQDTILSFTEFFIDCLPADIMAKFSDFQVLAFLEVGDPVKIVELTLRNVNKISPDAFKISDPRFNSNPFENVTTVVLDTNVKVIPEGLFKTMPKIGTVSFGGDNFRVLEEGALDIETLTQVTIFRSPLLTEIPEALATATQLKDINFKQPNNYNFPRKNIFKALVVLERLTLSGTLASFARQLGEEIFKRELGIRAEAEIIFS